MANIEPTRIFTAEPQVLAGLAKTYTFANMGEIPEQWAEFAPQIGSAVNAIEKFAFGVVSDMDSNGFRYMSAIKVVDPKSLPEGWSAIELPSLTFVEFLHTGHVSTLCETIDLIWKEWLPQSGKDLAEPSFMVEVYGDNFNPHTGDGDIGLWLAVKA